MLVNHNYGKGKNVQQNVEWISSSSIGGLSKASANLSDFTGYTNIVKYMKKVEIPEGITTIPKLLFYKCTNIQSVVIPVSLKTIEQSAFSNTSLTNVYYRGTQEQWNNITINDTNIAKVNIHYNYTP